MQKKYLILCIAAGIGVILAGFLAYQNTDEKKEGRHLSRANLLSLHKNYLQAKEEYQKAYGSRYSPTISIEVLDVENKIAVKRGDLKQSKKNIEEYLIQNPNDLKALRMLSDLGFLMGDKEISQQALIQILKLDEDNYDARMKLGKIRLDQSRPDLAEDQFRIMLSKQPDSTDVILQLAHALFIQKKIEDGKALLQDAIAKNADFNTARLMLVDGYLLNRELEPALALLDQWAVKDTSLQIPVAVRKARMFSLLGKLEEAEAILAPYKGDSLATPLQAIILVKNNRIGEALELYKTLVSATEGSQLEDHYSLLYYFLLLADKKSAQALELIKSKSLLHKGSEIAKITIACYAALDAVNKADEFILTQPEHLHSYLKDYLAALIPKAEYIADLSLVTYFQILSESTEVINTTESFYKKWPTNSLALNYYVQNLAFLNKHLDAISLLEKVKKPSLQQRTLLIKFYFTVGLNGRGIESSRSLLQENPQTKGVNALLGNFYYQHRQKELALNHFKQELALDSSNILALNNLAWEFGITEKNFSKAENILNRMTALKIKDPRIMDTMGWIYAQNQMYQKADSIFQACLLSAPDNPSILYHAAFTKTKLDQKQAAISYLSKALASPHSFEEKEEAARLLREQNR